MSAQFKKAPNFQAAAKTAGLAAVTRKPAHAKRRDPEIGRSPAIEAVAFSSAAGTVSDAIVTPQGGAIVPRGVAQQDVSPADFAMARDKFRWELLNERRTRFHQTYMEKAREEDED